MKPARIAVPALAALCVVPALASASPGTVAAERILLHENNLVVVPDDVRGLATTVLSHRLVLEPEAEFDGVTAEQVIAQILLDVPMPQENGTA